MSKSPLFPLSFTRLSVTALAGASLLLVGCANMSERQKGTASGAAIGAVGGAILSQATGGKAGTGAVVGGAIGAVAGNLWSKRMEDKRQAMEAATRGTGIDVARTTDNQLKVNIPADFSFDVGRSAIKPVMVPVLDKLAQGLDADMQMHVIGHTDDTGSDAVNNPLSLDRAEAVRDYLVELGADATLISPVGLGSNVPKNPKDPLAPENRRVEIGRATPPS